jgi:cytochrome c556
MLPRQEKPMIRQLLIAAMLTASASYAWADSPAIGQRQALLKEMGNATGPVGKMLRGDETFDLGKVQAALKVIVANTTKLPDLFPDDSQTGKTKALPAIWQNKSDVVTRFGKLHADAEAAVGAITSEASFKAEMPKVLGNCGACHQNYRAK